ncbi:MAG TPA: BON domain-containing protein [Gemmatimonadaceae bacterium]|jgi:osmotically-inducible protein OsmY
MPPFRYRDDDSSTGTTIASVLLGAIAGFAVGMYVAQRVGGFSGLTARFRRRGAKDTAAQEVLPEGAYDEIEDEIEDEAEIGATSSEDEDFNGMDAVEEDENIPLLEERVLEAFNNDPILAERAIDIGAMGTGSGVIELAGWVDSDDEAEHAMTIARGVPGVETVVNRLLVDDEEQQIGDNVRRFNEGDPALMESGWEGQQVGTGKRRQGTSDEADRHADPKPVLEDHWLSKREAVRNSADDIDEISAERRAKRGKGAKPPRADTAEPQTEA